MESDLYEMLGLPAGCEAEQLRTRYETAMAAANRWKDLPRAHALSEAFDRLPTVVRLAVYPVSGRGASRIEDKPPTALRARSPVPIRAIRPTLRRAPTAAGRRAAKRAQRRASARAAYQHTGMRKPFRIAFYAIGALIAVVVIGQLLQRNGAVDGPAPSPQHTQNVPTTRQTVVVAAPKSGHIAPSLPVGSDGQIVVICQKEAFGAGSMMRVRPGTYVECANGAMPHFVPGT